MLGQRQIRERFEAGITDRKTALHRLVVLAIAHRLTLRRFSRL